MTPAELVTILTALAGIISVFVSLVTATNSAKKDAVASLERMVDNLTTQVQRLSEENAIVRGIMDEVREENADLKAWAEELVRQIKGLGAEPAPFKPRGKE